MKRFILASASSSRARLLRAAGVEFEIVPAAVDESVLKRASVADGHDAATMALRLAAEKARSVAELHPDTVVLGADQILMFDGEAVSKCRDAREAFGLLRRLRGRTHELAAAAVLAANGAEIWNHVDICRMTMRNYSDAFLSMYVSRADGALLHSVGCYEFESLGVQLFDRVEGDFFSILGLPLLPVLAALREYGVIEQ
jgi:septum formation protein